MCEKQHCESILCSTWCRDHNPFSQYYKEVQCMRDCERVTRKEGKLSILKFFLSLQAVKTNSAKLAETILLLLFLRCKLYLILNCATDFNA